MKYTGIAAFAFSLIFTFDLAAQISGPPLVPEADAMLFAEELSGEAAKRNLEYLSRLHRMRGSRDFRAASEFIAGKLTDYGLSTVEILQFPADGKTMYGTQKARPAWNADFAELWELEEIDGKWERKARIADWNSMPVSLAQDSESADVTADLVDVGAGTSDTDYDDKNVRGKLVLISSQPGAAAPLAIDKHGAAGMVSYAPNQKTGWWKEDENLVRWGHLDSFTETRSFAFMISLKQARSFQQRLSRGDRIRLHAKVEAGRSDGFYDITTAVIEGADPDLKDEEIAFSCHLDHQRPGANDNASGCVTILEVARAFSKLINEGRIQRPRRTIRFIWPPEIEGTMALLNARPDFAHRIKAVIHMDMVGGGSETKAIFHVTRSPQSLPTFINDIAEAIGAFVNQESDAFASGQDTPFALTAPEGGKEALQASLAPYSGGSDHQIYTEGSFKIPAIYLNDWPDRFIHTNYDTPANIDPTKLKRAAFIGGGSAWVLANLTDDDIGDVWQVMKSRMLTRAAVTLTKSETLSRSERENLSRHALDYERGALKSLDGFAATPDDIERNMGAFLIHLEQILGAPGSAPHTASTDIVYHRNPDLKGPVSVFGYNYFTDHYAAAADIRLFSHQGLWGGGGDYAYEALNFVDGSRTVTDIRNALSAEFGPIPEEIVEDYLRALAEIGIIQEN